MNKRKIVGAKKCKHPLGRGKPSKEFTINGIDYYFCRGWTYIWCGEIHPICRNCPAHIFYAQKLLEYINSKKEEKL